METEVLLIRDAHKETATAAAALAMAGAIISYHKQGHMPFDPPLPRRLPTEPSFEKTAGDRERLLKAVEKRKRKRIKAIRDLGR